MRKIHSVMDFITQLPIVGIEIIKNKQDQTYFIILLVLSVRDITVVCRLQHQNTPKKTHTEHVDCFFCVNTWYKTRITILSNITISKAKSPRLRLTATEHMGGGAGVLSLLLLRTFCSYILCSKVRFLSFNLVLVVSNVIKWTRNKHTKIIYSLLSCSLFPSTQQFFFSFFFLRPCYIWARSGSSSSSSARYWLQLGSPLTVGADGIGRPVWGLTHQHSPLWPWRDILHWNTNLFNYY